MLDQLKNCNKTKLEPSIIHIAQEISISDLPSIFSQKLILLRLSESSPLYSTEDFPEQYEPVHYDESTNTVTHYILKSGDSGDSTSITSYLIEFLETGKVTPRVSKGTTNIHNIPLPAYPIEEYNGEYVPCVLLKNNKRAIIKPNGNIIEGVELA